MPVYSRYWKNPEHHRAERRARYRAKGWKGIRSYSSYLATLAAVRRWWKAHPKEALAYAKKFRLKLIKLYGSSSNRSRYLHKIFHGRKRAPGVKL